MMMSPRPLLICRIGTARLAVPAEAVAEILPMLPLWRPPTLPRPLVGFAALRGRALPVLSPLLLFDAAATLPAIDLYAHLVRLRAIGGLALCLLVERAEDMVTVEAATIRPVTSEHSQYGCVTGQVAVDDGVAHVVDVDRLLLVSERSRIADLARAAERRATEWTLPA